MIRLNGRRRSRCDCTALVMEAVELGPVGDLRQRIAGRLFVQRLHALLERDLRRGVVHQDGHAVRNAVLAVDRQQVGIDIDLLAAATGDAQAAQGLGPAANRLDDRAFVVREQPVPLVAQRHQARRPVLVLDAGRRNPRQPFGRPVPVHDPQRAIDENHRVGHAFQQLLAEQAVRQADVARQRALGQLPLAGGRFRLQLLEPAAADDRLQLHLVGADKAAEFLHQPRIELRAGEFKQLGQGPLARHGAAIDLVAGHRVEGVDDRHHPGADRQLLAAEVVAFASAVEPGPGILHDPQHFERCRAGPQNIGADLPMPLDTHELFRRELRRLEQDVVGNPDLADIVQQGRDFELVAFYFTLAQHRAPGRAIEGDSQAVGGGGGVLGSQGRKQAAADPEPHLHQLVFEGQQIGRIVNRR